MSSIALLSCGRPERLCYCLRIVKCDPEPVRVEMSLEIFMRAKVTVRANGSRVNSVFLVQLRKKVATDFRGSTRIKQQPRDASFYR